MKQLENTFEKKRIEFNAELLKAQLRRDGISLEDYPWDTCVAEQTDRYGDEETARKVCGMIKSKYGGGE